MFVWPCMREPGLSLLRSFRGRGTALKNITTSVISGHVWRSRKERPGTPRVDPEAGGSPLEDVAAVPVARRTRPTSGAGASDPPARPGPAAVGEAAAGAPSGGRGGRFLR